MAEFLVKNESCEMHNGCERDALQKEIEQSSKKGVFAQFARGETMYDVESIATVIS